MTYEQRPQDEGRTPNRLIHEKSPYLLQHAYNPVDWRPWNDEAFETARREDKPIFLSIGYSTCHWCHVMEHESFEDDDVARLMNETFVCVKVDREERADIDNVYMRVCQMLTGSGGWPLTLIMTPDQEPFFAATYLPKDDRFGNHGMLALIPRIQEVWRTRRQDILKSAAEITAALGKVASTSARAPLGEAQAEEAFKALSDQFDWRHGGFGRAPKFPTPHTLRFLLRRWNRTGDRLALDMTERTLQAMRRGGIYDHIGFGFHRYATDAKWLVPHFEKMLYDQALLVMAYAEAFQAAGKQEYRATAEETLAYLARAMTSTEGGLYSAEDADSEGEEGRFYVWEEAEVRAVLDPAEAELVIRVFHLSESGNFTEQGSGAPAGKNIFHRTESWTELAAELGIPQPELERRWEAARRKLFEKRQQRVHPYKDDKILADWNGLAVAALAQAAQAFDAPQHAEAGQRAADFILTRMRRSDGGLWHRYREGESSVEGHLDDYAFMIWGLIELYQANFHVRNLQAALELNAYALEHFWDAARGGFYFTAGAQKQILIRSRETYDGAVPSGNAVQLLNLLRLARLTGLSDLEERAQELAEAFGALIRESPAAFTQWMISLDFALGPSSEVVIAGEPEAPDTRAMLQALRGEFLPNKVVLLRPPGAGGDAISRVAAYAESITAHGGEATAYVCHNYRCDQPTTDPQHMLRLLQGLRSSEGNAAAGNR
ncbi:MAG: thioredoxin domain-containing protein [Terriglobia bacterium]